MKPTHNEVDTLIWQYLLGLFDNIYYSWMSAASDDYQTFFGIQHQGLLFYRSSHLAGGIDAVTDFHGAGYILIFCSTGLYLFSQ